MDYKWRDWWRRRESNPRRLKTLTVALWSIRCALEFSAVLWSAPQSWRHVGDGRLRMASVLDKASPYDVHLTVFL